MTKEKNKINGTKTRVWVIFSKKDLERLDEVAAKEKRSRSNLILKIVTDGLGDIGT